MLKSLINQLLLKTKLVAKLNWAHAKKGSKNFLRTLTGFIIDTGIDLGHGAGGLVTKQIKRSKHNWVTNREQVRVINEMKEELKDVDPTDLKAVKRRLVDEHQENKPDATIRESVEYVQPYINAIGQHVRDSFNK